MAGGRCCAKTMEAVEVTEGERDTVETSQVCEQAGAEGAATAHGLVCVGVGAAPMRRRRASVPGVGHLGRRRRGEQEEAARE